jgi:uncharacterized protein (DUF2147 family)
MIRRNARALRRTTLIAAALAVLAAPVIAQATGPDPSGVLGLWLSEKEKVLVDIYRCEDELCAKIVWLAKPYRRSGEFKRDRKNPDPALRDRGWCGIEVIRGLKAKTDGVWESGRFYYPKGGQTFDIDIEKQADTELKIRAYLGLRLLGKSEIWTRPEPGQTVGCVAAPNS